MPTVASPSLFLLPSLLLLLIQPVGSLTGFEEVALRSNRKGRTAKDRGFARSVNRPWRWSTVAWRDSFDLPTDLEGLSNAHRLELTLINVKSGRWSILALRGGGNLKPTMPGHFEAHKLELTVCSVEEQSSSADNAGILVLIHVKGTCTQEELDSRVSSGEMPSLVFEDLDTANDFKVRVCVHACPMPSWLEMPVCMI